MSQIPISVIMPVYNGARYLRECLDSILCQTFRNFELLIVDDGSTDDTCDIIRSYSDNRIRLIVSQHDYIASCNLLLKEAKGKYLARMDADDIMMPDRLKVQYEYMERHPDVSVVSGYFADVDKEVLYSGLSGYRCSLERLLNVNCVVNPTSMLRKADVERCGIVYECEYIYAEDYRFWSRVLMCGLEIRVLPYHFVRYRFSFTQSTSTHRKEVIRSANKVRSEISSYLSRLYYHDYTPPTIVPKGKKMSVLIPFANEGEEVYNTVKNIKGLVGDKVDIIVCNDQSTDGYDYAKVLKDFTDVYYFYNANRLGVTSARDYCVSLCATPYFILLDAHMRFYTDDWVEILVDILEKDDRCVLCCQSKALKKKEGHLSDVVNCPQSYGALMPFKSTDLTGIKWRYDEILKTSTEPIPAILGAGYAASKRYWAYIDGLRGLRSYGTDEQYLSMKVWLEGGRCLLVKNVLVGHIYREKSPYVRNRVDEYFNKLLLSEVFFGLSQKCWVLTMLYLQDKATLANAADLCAENKSEIVSIAERQKSIRTGSLREYARFTRNLCPKECEQDELSEALLQAAVQKILYENPKMSGIGDGKMGYILWLSLYNRLTANCSVSQKISELWQCVKEDIDQRLLPLNFRNGLLGIGWGLIYMQEHGFLDDDPCELLECIDRELQQLSVEKVYETNVDFGLGGVYAYVNARILNSKKDAGAYFEKSFLEALHRKAQLLLREGLEDHLAIYQMVKFEMWTTSKECADQKLDCSEWMTYKSFVPANIMYAEKGLSGNLMSTTFQKMSLILKFSYQ